MLQRLSIRNYAIIDEVEICFSGKLNAITGETGAGKSIIMGALALILGERADTAVLVSKEKKCIVEGLFHTKGKALVREFMEKAELDAGDEIIIRREIGTNGKSRAFVNDTPVTLVQLTELSSLMVDLHQQFDTHRLGENHFQREVLDALAGHNELLRKYQQIFKRWQGVKKESEALTEQKQRFEKEFDYNKFQYNELDEAAFRENELEELEATLKLLSNSEEIKSMLSEVYDEVAGNERPVVQQLKILANRLSSFSSFHPGLPMLLRRLQEAQVELQDIAAETQLIGNHINYDPEKIQQISERLSTGYKLLKKHGVKSTSELLRVREQLAEKLQTVLNLDGLLQEKEKELAALYSEVTQEAKKISDGRGRQIKSFEEKVNALLARVGMPHAKLKVELRSKEGAPGIYGTDIVEYLFNANLPAKQNTQQVVNSGPFQSIGKVASGGELSRLMLCIKSLVAQSMDLPTMIFDEMDSGISGEAARQVGILLKELSVNRQVICITHQPQMAGRADAHFFVYKEMVNGSIKTNIRELSAEERITVIARMLSGEKPTAAAIENAKEMVGN